MPTKAKPKGKGKGLKKNLGPFPTYVWLLIGVIAVVGYIYYRRRQSQTAASSIAGSLNQQTIPSGVIIPPSSSGTSGSLPASSTGDTGTSASPNTFPYDYATNTDLQSGLNDLSNQVGAQIAGITFPQPSVNITVPNQPNSQTPNSHPVTATQTSKTAAKKAAASVAPSHIRYYTYKKNVPLRAGQTLHFTKSKGYYAS